MKRWLRGSVVLATAAGLWSCSGDPTDVFRGGASRIIASPSSVFLNEGETEAVLVEALDEQGNPLPVTFDLTVGSGISVVQDPDFLPTNGSGPIEGQVRYQVTANTAIGTSFTVSADGQSTTIPVRSLPLTFAGTFSSATPALGETVTLTAPAGLKFGPDTDLQFPGSAGGPVITDISADSTVLSFLPGPGTDTVGFVSGVEMLYAPGVPLATLETTTKVTTPAVTEIPAVFSNAAPAVNEVVTVTAPGFIFLPGATVTVGASTATTVALAADGSSMGFVAAPGATGIPTIAGTALDFLPSVPLELPATTNVTVSGAVPAAAGTDDPATAPSLVTPEPGFASIFYDAPDFPAAVDRFYKLVVTEDGDYTITMDWTVGSDVDMFLCPAPGAITGSCDFAAASGAIPESHTYTLTAGTYWIVADDFGLDAAPTILSILIVR